MSSHRFSIDIAADHPAFGGHFPGHPVLPGVVLLAEVLAGIERSLGLQLDAVEIRVAKFHAPVLPGCVLTVDLVHAGAIHAGAIAFTVSCDQARVATGNITMNDGKASRQPEQVTTEQVATVDPTSPGGDQAKQ